MGPMPTATTQRHPPDQLIHAIRAALLSTIKAECPEVLDDLRDSVFTPLSLWMTRDDIVALLRRYSPRVHDPRLGSAHHQVPRADRVLGTTLASHRALDTRRSVAHVTRVGSVVWGRTPSRTRVRLGTALVRGNKCSSRPWPS